MQIEIKHFNNSFSSKPIHHLCDDFGKTNTDTTTWRPDFSLIHAQANALSGRKLIYDFPDGKDSGESVQTFVRSKGIDITEIETAEQRITQIIEDKKKTDKENFDKKEQRKKDLKDLLDALKNNPDDSSQSSPDTQNSQN